MTGDLDHYEAYYADKLWNLLPAVYRTQDSGQSNTNGPLRELVERIGAQAAVLRRSMDRMWEDQSIETCDDWVIPYLGDLLATNLAPHLDAAGQRLDVANTISYRRRKGTLAVLEEIATDLTGWDAKVVEFFRRLARTRHGLDPAPGPRYATPDVARLQLAEGLIGPLTGTGIGGLADLRKAYGASAVGTVAGAAFDEFFHTADLRRGQGQSGWYNIPRLGVFLWRLQSFGVKPTTPVSVTNCPGWYTFDPTGRNVPLFAVASRAADSYGDNWVSPVEAQVPTPIRQPLYDAQYPPSASPPPAPVSAPPFPLYPDSLAVFPTPTPQMGEEALPTTGLKIRPEIGRFELVAPHSPSAPAWVTYHYGFSSTIGAGPYDRRLGRNVPPTPGAQVMRTGGGVALTAAGSVANTGPIPSAGTVTFTDSLTYTTAGDVTVRGALTIRADVEERPVLRRSATPASWTEWTFNGAVDPTDKTNCLVLDGLLISGADLVLAGSFDCVTLTCCTLDPGNSAFPAGSTPPFAPAADQQELVPCRLWIEGTVGSLTVERCITGPIRTRNGGQVQSLTVTDSIIQAIPTARAPQFQVGDVKDPGLTQPSKANGTGLVNRLLAPDDPVALLLRSRSPALVTALAAASPPVLQTVLNALNSLLQGRSLYDRTAFQNVRLSAATQQLLAQVKSPVAPAPLLLNRQLLEDAYPLELADAALAFTDGDVNLSRCTVLGRAAVHRLEASECILRDLVLVDDAQHGCVRFSAWPDGSIVPRQFESVAISQGATLFAATDFGKPAYCQLLPTVDAAILPAPGAASPALPTIAAGAADGSEMGAFAREKNPIKERGLLIKFQEFMPAGLVPVLIYAT